MVSVMIILTLLVLLVVAQALLTALSAIARLLWAILGVALVYGVMLQFWGR